MRSLPCTRPTLISFLSKDSLRSAPPFSLMMIENTRRPYEPRERHPSLGEANRTGDEREHGGDPIPAADFQRDSQALPRLLSIEQPSSSHPFVGRTRRGSVSDAVSHSDRSRGAGQSSVSRRPLTSLATIPRSSPASAITSLSAYP